MSLGVRDRHRCVYPRTHAPLHTHMLPVEGPTPEGSPTSWGRHKQERRQVTSDVQSVPVLNDGRRAAPGTSGKSCDLKEPQGLSPKAVWVGDDYEPVQIGFIGNDTKFGSYEP